MANTLYTSLVADNIGKLWDGKSFDSLIPSDKTAYAKYINNTDTTGIWGWRYNNWGCDGRIYHASIAPNSIKMLTASSTPWFVVSKLSKLLGDTELVHSYCDQSIYKSDLFEIIWKNGKMKKAFVREFNIETDEYFDKKEISVTDKFNQPLSI